VRRVYQNMGKAPRGSIYYTSDGGQSWTLQYEKRWLDTAISALYKQDDERIWALGDEGSVTQFKDNRWNEVDFEKGRCNKHDLLDTIGGNDKQEIYEPLDMSFADPFHGWLTFRNGFMATTADSGMTWCDLRPPSYAAPSSESLLVRIHFVTSTDGWAIDNNGEFFRSGNAGVTWVKVDLPGKFSEMFFLDANHGWGVGSTGVFR